MPRVLATGIPTALAPKREKPSSPKIEHTLVTLECGPYEMQGTSAERGEHPLVRVHDERAGGTVLQPRAGLKGLAITTRRLVQAPHVVWCQATRERPIVLR